VSKVVQLMTHNKRGERLVIQREGDDYFASLRGIPCAGQGRTREEALERLCLVLGDFVDARSAP
jgi:predicted RNase H-like HicB family nuclease